MTTLTTSVAFPTPNLSHGFTPQGMTATPSGKLMLAEYKAGENTRLVDVTVTGSIYGQISIAEGHAGGLAFVGDWLFVQDDATTGSDTVRRYALDDINAALATSHAAAGHPTYVAAAGTQTLDPWEFASVMVADGDQLLSGHHGVGEGARLYRYDVNQATGLLTSVGYVYFPENAQGIALDSSGSVVTAAGGGHLFVGGVDYTIPSHVEGIVIFGSTIYMSFENGAANVLKATMPS